jgi:hypothetical protein
MPVTASPQGDVLPNAPFLRVEVSQEIIDRACVKDSSHCMIADSVRACYPWARNITVDIQTVRLSDPERGVRFTYLTPRQAQIALLDFDAGIPAEPFNFTLPRRSAHVQWMRRQAPKRVINESQRAAVRGNMQKARRYNPKSLQVDPNGDHERVQSKGGQSPPVGALAAGSTGRKRDGDIPTARRRTYGLRAMGSQARRQVAPE